MQNYDKQYYCKFKTTSYKYLGVILDNRLTLQEHVNNVCKKCSTRIKLLSRLRQNMGPNVANTIYNSMIKPIALYCYPACVIWNFQKSQ